MGRNTGRKVKIYIDSNPNSPTFLEEKEVIIEDSASCPIDDIKPIWVEIGREPELIKYYPSGAEGFSSYAIVTYRDENPDSSSFGETKTERVKDPNYPRPDTNPKWELINSYCARYDYCEIDEAIPEEDIDNLFK